MRRPSLLGTAVVVAAALLCPIVSIAASYKVDQSHTSVTFRVRHIFTTVAGRFNRFDGRIVFDEKRPLETKVDGSIETASINTDNEKRDDHLRSADFFDVATYPKITFSTLKVTDVDEKKNTVKLHGTLSMHGVEKPVILDAAFFGAGKDPWGNLRAGFRGTMTINRKDFGLNWNKTLETGGLLVGEEIEIQIDVEAVQEK